MKRVLLYFGSFNPVHNGHIALAEYALEQGLCDEVALIVSPQSPYKQAADLAPEMERFEMAEIACAASRYPELIRPSVVEFLLLRPSYTIDTLRYLEQQCGDSMRFAILMGGDQIARLDGWKEHEKLLEYPIYVYPRREASTERLPEGVTLLAGAPLLDISATGIRTKAGCGEDISTLVCPGVADYIRRKDLWSVETTIRMLDERLAAQPDDTALLLRRGECHFRRNDWGKALNDFNKVLRIDPDRTEAQQYAQMIREILEFRYKDIYNP